MILSLKKSISIEFEVNGADQFLLRYCGIMRRDEIGPPNIYTGFSERQRGVFTMIRVSMPSLAVLCSDNRPAQINGSITPL